MRRRVVALNLRNLDSDGALAQVALLLNDPAEHDLTRLLIIDDADRLPRHDMAFEELLRSRRVDSVLCVVVGRTGAEADGRTGRLEVPGAIQLKITYRNSTKM